jgi:magnesium and cobalt transporter
MAAVLDLSAKRGIIDHDASSLLREIVSLADLRVGDIMVPRVDVVAYDVDAPREGLLDLVRRTHLRRIPVYEKDLDHVVGVIHAKRLLLDAAAPLRSLVVSVPFVPEHANVERLLHQLRIRRSQIAVVVDEYGGTAGVVLLRDALEEIVGELPGPGEDRGAAVEELPDGKYLIDADLAIHEWVDAFKIDLKGERISTVGGFVTSLLGRIAKEGDAVTYRNLRFAVASMRGRRIGKLRLELLEESR